MQSLRIALGLLFLVATFFLILPAEPTLFAAHGGIENAAIATAETVAPSPAEKPAPQPVAAAPVRTIGSTAIETTALTRLPPVASGAATPRTAEEPGAPAAAAEVETVPTETRPDAATEPAPAPANDGPAMRVFARPIAVDAGTLKAGEFTLVVAGVAPLASDARCTDGAQAWPCATRARTALRSWLRGRSVLCSVPPDAADAREIEASCRIGEEDVGEWVVRNGWAHAAPDSRYEDAERDAREARRGIWAYGLDEEVTARSGG
jgi:endonuclease YncB( thermonuclease family)